ncbi:MAG: RNA polymerase sigma factor [Chthoniobacteraceae bacterium]
MSDTSDRQARFLAFLAPLRSELEAYARRMLWEPQDAADALQNAVLRAFAAFDRYREDASFRGWRYRILTNEIFALNRRHSRRAKFEFQLAPEELVALAGAADTERTAGWAEALDDRLSRALHSLPENERTVLVLRGVSGLAYHEIAVALDMPLGSVMGYLSRGRQKMRAALAKTEFDRRKQTP